MTVTEQLMKPGQWALDLSPSTPRSITAAMVEFGHVVITPAQMSPVGSFSDAQMKARAIYAGVVLRRSSPFHVEGEGLATWLGDGDGKGYAFEARTSIANQTLSSALGTILPGTAPITPGTVTNTSLNNVTMEIQYITGREAVDQACAQAGAEWRINPDGTLDAALASTLFVGATPRVVVTPNSPGGMTGTTRGLENIRLTSGLDADEWSSRVFVLGKGEGSAVSVGAASAGSNPYLDYRGNTARMTRFVQASDASTDTAAANVAASLINLYSSPRASLTLSDDTYGVPLWIRPGDSIYVYDPAAGIMDTANQVDWQGQTITPEKVRVYGYTWPIRRGLGVYYRDLNGVYTDLTDWVAWESSATTYDVGTPRSGITSAGTGLGINGSVSNTAGFNRGQPYTPVLTASSVNPTIGTSGNAQVGWYLRDGDFVTGTFSWTFGSSGPSAGTGTYMMSLPFSLSASVSSAIVGRAFLNNGSGTVGWFDLVASAGGNTAQFAYLSAYPTGSDSRVSSSAPLTWGGGGRLQGWFAYLA